jgi:hypothetical protein
MPVCVEDKENQQPTTPQAGGGKFFAADAKIAVKNNEGGRRGFSRLLADASNAVKCEYDEKLATKIQDTDALSMVNEWVQEINGQHCILAVPFTD